MAIGCELVVAWRVHRVEYVRTVTCRCGGKAAIRRWSWGEYDHDEYECTITRKLLYRGKLTEKLYEMGWWRGFYGLIPVGDDGSSKNTSYRRFAFRLSPADRELHGVSDQ